MAFNYEVLEEAIHHVRNCSEPLAPCWMRKIDADVKQRGGRHIKFMCIIAAPEGLDKLSSMHPDIEIYVGNLDRCLNENAYICPGLGDAGDRIFGTK